MHWIIDNRSHPKCRVSHFGRAVTRTWAAWAIAKGAHVEGGPQRLLESMEFISIAFHLQIKCAQKLQSVYNKNSCNNQYSNLAEFFFFLHSDTIKKKTLSLYITA